ncbi:MAG: putative ABC transport system ATP-binding protein [Candidatus Aldehydirespiratoraceae bacterium]|jgi:putative ABC transport system ATP-binding protein
MGDGCGVISLEGVRFRWPGQSADTVAIDELHLDAGEHLFVRGSSGSGKTTLLNLLCGVHTPSSGKIRLLGTDLATLPQRRRDQFRADHIGVVFQQFNLLPYLTTLENVTLACSFSGRKRRRATESTDVASSARELLEALNLTAELHSAPVSKLSVGQQQRVAVARALIGGPEILIADEPTSALDADNRDRFMDLLFREAEAKGCTLVFVSHDPQLAERFDRSIELDSSSDKIGSDR